MRRFKSLHLAMLTLGSLCLNSAYASDTLHSLSDSEMSATTGQSLFTLQYLAPGDTGNTYTASTGNIGFYTLGMEAEVSLNANIKTMQLGCGGVNGDGACDIDAQNVSFGCIANDAGVCITLPKTYASQPNGTAKNNADVLTEAQEASGNIPYSLINSTLTASPQVGNVTQNQMKDFVLSNPFFQFAIKNPNSASTREVVGFRIGAQGVNGPLSFGNLKTFSGYLSGTGNFTMEGETNISPVASGQSKYSPGVKSCSSIGTNCGYLGDSNPASGYMGMANAEIVNILGISINYRDLTMDYGTQSRNNLAAVANGNRITQVFIPDLKLSSLVDDIVNGLSVNQICATGLSARCSPLANNDIANLLLPALKGGDGTSSTNGVKDYVKRQLEGGLGLNPGDHVALENYKMPFNISNIHQIQVSADSFGISVQGQALQYPGYAAAVPKGWAMYAKDAFTLNVSAPTSELVTNIAASSFARDGNITLLAPSYRNCYGNLKFC